MSEGFYRAFEERYYAPREVIKALRMQYLPFVQPIADLYPRAAIFDAGCGRGEWLELMGELGLSPFGVDLDEGMLSACVELDLPAIKGDAVNYIATLPSSSQVVVSAFHVVEHIAFEQLQTLVAEALRVLKPGGLLIMETPNPENIVVATCNFYLDPTHQRPIPPKLLAFVAEHAGFARVKTLRLQQAKELVSRSDVSLHDVFAGASPDYAVVAQKHASDEVLALASDPFAADLGLSLEDLLGRWDSRFDRLETKAQEAERKAQQAENAAQQSEVRAQQSENAAQQSEVRAQQSENAAQQLEVRAMKAEAELSSIINSRSFRFTQHLRRGVAASRTLCNRPTQVIKSAVHPLSRRFIRFVSAKPRLKRSVLALLRKHPRLEQKLRQYAFTIWNRLDQEPPQLIEETNLSTRARKILSGLKVAIEKNNKGAA